LPYWDSLLFYFLIIVLFWVFAKGSWNDLKLLQLASPFMAFWICLISPDAYATNRDDDPLDLNRPIGEDEQPLPDLNESAYVLYNECADKIVSIWNSELRVDKNQLIPKYTKKTQVEQKALLDESISKYLHTKLSQTSKIPILRDNLYKDKGFSTLYQEFRKSLPGGY
jgi:hypothetical protein